MNSVLFQRLVCPDGLFRHMFPASRAYSQRHAPRIHEKPALQKEIFRAEEAGLSVPSGSREEELGQRES